MMNRTLDEELKFAAEHGPNYHTLCSLERLGHVVQAKKLTDIPETPHWQVQEVEMVPRYTGYEASEGAGSLQPYWRIWVFNDEDIFLRFMRVYYAWLADPHRERRGYGKSEDVYVGIDCSGKVVTKVQVVLASKPRKRV